MTYLKGVIDTDYDRLITTKYDVFISYYSDGGESWASHIYYALPKHNLRAFYAPKCLPDSYKEETEKYWDVIEASIRNSRYCILLMTPGFNSRESVIREIFLMLKHGKKCRPYKHLDTPSNDLRVQIPEHGEIDYKLKNYKSIDDKDSLFNDLLPILQGKKSIDADTPKYVFIEKVLKPLYYSLKVIIQDIDVYYRGDFQIWDEVNKDYKWDWDDWKNQELKIEIEQIYKQLSDRQIIIESAYGISESIINACLLNYLRTKDIKLIGDNTPRLDVNAEVVYIDGKKDNTPLNLNADLLYDKLGYTIKRNKRIADFKIKNCGIYSPSNKYYEISQSELNDIWNNCKENIDKNEYLNNLCKSTHEIKKQAIKAKNDIDDIIKEGSGFF